ncbi:MAG: DMT family transporter [Gemmatimonadota bacterium]|nr:DMT family transporter [Gemmatimonadota bacterium]
MTNPRAIPIVPIVAAVLMFGSAFPATKVALRSYSPGPLSLLRFAVASVAFGVVVALLRVPLPPRRELPRLIAVGLMLNTGYHILFSYGQRAISAGSASVLVNTGAIWTALVAALVLNERPDRVLWLGLFLSFAGATLIALGTGGHFRGGLGALLVLGAAALQGSAFVMQKPLANKYNPIGVAAVTVWVGCVGLAVPFSRDVLAEVAAAPNSATLAIVYLGIASTIALASWAYVLSQMPAAQAGLFILLVPLVATIVAAIWLHEIPSWLTGLGGLLTLGGIFLAQWMRTKTRPAERLEPA